jgi:hypothetical protein
VQVSERWKVFENFLMDMGERPSDTTLGRFGDVGNYEMGNCAWMTKQQQLYTRRANEKANVDSSTGVKGVGWDKSRKLFRAQIRINGKNMSLGRFITIGEAEQAYQKAKESMLLCLREADSMLP